MKKVIFSALLFSTPVVSFTETNLFEISNKSKTISKSKIDINITLTSKEGCKFKIVGTYNSWTGVFKGTVTASGPNGCANGKWTFGLAHPNNGSNGNQNFDDKEIIIIGRNPFTDELRNDPEMLHTMRETISM